MAEKKAATKMPDTPEERRTLLDQQSANHDTLTAAEIKEFDKLAAQVAKDEDLAVDDEADKIKAERKSKG